MDARIPNEVADNLRRVRTEIDRAASRAGRPGEVTLVAVSKTVPAARVRAAYDAGQRVFGENRVLEGVEKVEALADQLPEAQWHLIGHLQSNKARRAVMAFSLVESVDSVRLARRLDDLAAELGRRLPVFLEINVAGESAKSGFTPDEVRSELHALVRLSHLSVRGLMTVAPLVSDPEEVRPVFRALRELRDEIRDSSPVSSLEELSMGMSGDFPIAIEEGATMVRIGRAIFGVRPLR